MTLAGWGMIVLFTVLFVALAKPAGAWLHALYARETLPLGSIERGFYRVAGVDPKAEQSWVGYAVSLMVFNVAGIVFLFAILKLQGLLPLNPQGFGGVETLLAFNTAVSFVTNTNWQNYGGETTLSHLSQMLGLTVQNFLSAATGIAVAFAFIRGFARRQATGIGNFWVDVTRVTIYLLLPACIVLALVYVALGVPQTFAASVTATTVEGAQQLIALGPVASQLAIKMLGTNGGGFFNVNSAHPFENPSALVNMIQMLTIFVLGAGLTLTFGKAVGNVRQGWALLAAMVVLFLIGVTVAYWAEAAGNPIHQALGLAGGNMEGKEVRFGIAATVLFAVVTTAASCGAVIGMHDSFMPLGGLVTMFNIQLGEIVVGGVGTGFYGMLIYAILAVFIAGLMVGRTPEYIGKKIEAREMKLAVIAIAILPLMILGLTAIASVTSAGLAGPLAKGPHGFSEILYAFSSAVGNNGSAFGGLTGNTAFYNLLLALGMFVGRFGVILPVLAIAGGLAAKRHIPPGAGSFPTTGLLWVGLLVAIILIVGGLTFLPSLALGPIADQAQVAAGTLL
ncbi:potassium-transporting ATPase potassium-binding subunit [Polymorphobacter multimanifer]|uniref:Potassium-transporting ATPase potassium-binding subunit n=1 Tax=Polymorphobacter multimanifer TaxID=1070431 RepID=A0A841L536_9SPHN|nr:potassium-transporting ATPase subunit KdpA [Polymorphobacter multimanifer]MBB6226083.1 K+-transporting ATPase ATPase A chain [Polymorphobacter multimanifer]GGI76284.1 potassium-transporting ATPase potassium-binding subunit [Polymorphobacter multimanifer]